MRSAEPMSDAVMFMTPPAPPPAPPLPPGVAPAAARARPRVWTVFAAFGAVVGGVLVAQVIFGVVAALWLLASGEPPARIGQAIMDLLDEPMMFVLIALPSQLAILGVALAAARLSPEPMAERLGLLAPRLPAWAWPCLVLGTIVPLAIGALLAGLMPPPPDGDMILRMWGNATPMEAVIFVLFIAIVPGFSEEIFMRGYVQRRLLRAWRPLAAIAVSSILFALLHVTPTAMTFVLPIGIWLGVMAWRTNSVWPGIVCHAVLNGTWNTWQMGSRLAGISPDPTWPALVILLAVGLVCFIAAVVALWRRPPATQPAFA